MFQFRSYAEQLQELARLCSTASSSIEEPRIERALNGEAADTLFARVPIDVLRRAGAFFTPPKYADRLVEPILPQLTDGIILDPACGAGDLLLACARRLPIARDLPTTLQRWGRQLHGFDIHPEFITATKARLTLLAISRGAAGAAAKLRAADLFPNIRVADFLSVDSLSATPISIVMNPPFHRAVVPKTITWGTGLITRAAVFVAKCVELAPPGTVVSALLPDVLRSGSRYAHWRSYIERYARPSNVEPLGVFNDKADVDVFLVTLVRGPVRDKAARRQWLSNDASHDIRPTLSSICDIRVGPVVPFRDPESGPLRRYVTTKVLPPWKTASELLTRKYGGEAFAAPFVAVRRTSRANDPRRAVATIVDSKRPVAVENHLIVLLPKGKVTLAQCRYLVRVLQDPRTTTWLNERICCRHLTTTALKQLPLWFDR